ncbi:MAG: zinc ribbon domain-containing protein [Planctomycetes bacterium]|nr:zinc ribbon domain-containing protein [Planctomycetota bacterium]
MAVPATSRPPLLDAVGIFKEAWELFTRQWQAWLLIGVCYFFVALVLVSTCIGSILLGAITAGLYVAAFKQLRGQVPEVRDLFQGFQWFGPVTLLTIMAGFCIFLGTLLCIIPGLVLMVWWRFALPLCITHGLGATDAMAMSKRKVQEGFWDIVVLMLVIMAVNMVAGMIPLGQILVGLPLQTLMMAIAHRDLFGLEGALPPVGRGPSPPFPGQPMPPVGCPRCGAANASGTRFCTACGGPIA